MKNFRRSTMFWAILCGCAIILVNPICTQAKSIGKDQVNIRSKPSLRGKVLFEAPLGYPIKIEEERGKWVFFRDWVGNTGWVYKSLVSNIDTAVIKVVKANLRSGPGIRNKITGYAKQGEIYKVIGKDGNWSRLALYYGSDPVGWIRDDLIFGG